MASNNEEDWFAVWARSVTDAELDAIMPRDASPEILESDGFEPIRAPAVVAETTLPNDLSMQIVSVIFHQPAVPAAVTAETLRTNPPQTNNNVTLIGVMYIYGRTADGKSVMVHGIDFRNDKQTLSDFARNFRRFSWIKISKLDADIVAESMRQSTCQLELMCMFERITPDFAVAKTNVAPFCIMSFDIETEQIEGDFGGLVNGPIIQISCISKILGDRREPREKFIFCRGWTAAIDGARVQCYETEAELLCAWTKFVCDVDPDIITGYNIKSFDIRTIIDNAIALRNEARAANDQQTVSLLGKSLCFGRLQNVAVQSRKSSGQRSKTIGSMHGKIPGRIVLDMMQTIKKIYPNMPPTPEAERTVPAPGRRPTVSGGKYTLNNVSRVLLNEGKKHYDSAQITALFSGTAETRRELAEYCLKDALLPLKLMDCVENSQECKRQAWAGNMMSMLWLINSGQEAAKSVKQLKNLTTRVLETGLMEVVV